MATQRTLVEFDRADLSEVMAAMDELAAAHRGWINIEPIVHEDDLDEYEPPIRAPLATHFSASGPELPYITFQPGRTRRRGREPRPIVVGILHPAGPKVARSLADLGHGVPTGWTIKQDHPRRGLVAELPPEPALDETLEWLLDAASALSAVPIRDEWSALVHRP